MDLTEAIYTTRAMRRLEPDPVPQEVLARLFDAAVRGPSGGNEHRFRFLTVTDAETKGKLGAVYRRCLDEVNNTKYRGIQEALQSAADDPALAQAGRIDSSSRYLAEHLQEAPLLVFAFGKQGGESSVFPALWNFCLAARGEGYGTAITTLLRFARDEVHGILGVPADSEWGMMAMVPCGRPKGKWGLAKRRPAHEVVYEEQWKQEPTWRCDEPAWVPSY